MLTPLCDNIYWVGCVDWHVRDFHSYEAHRGSTYNAYLLRDEKTALIDAVKGPFAADLLRNVSALCEPAKLDYIVCNHAEPDHSGALPEVMRAAANATLVCDAKCAATLAQHYDTAGWRTKIVASGEQISLGRRTLRFFETPMVHWPESMFTYVPEEQLLFSMDAFGQHYASSQRFDDQLPLDVVLEEAKAYYANIILPYGKSVGGVLEQTAALPIRMIAPSHGLIWRTNLPAILGAYRNWCAHRAQRKVLIVYDSMWESTTAMADAIAEGVLTIEGVEVLPIHSRRTSLTKIATEVLDAAAVAFGSATLNREMMPSMAGALGYLKGLRPQKKAGLAFGSYGWGRGGPEAIQEWLETACWEIVRPMLRSQYRPTEAILAECREAGKLLGRRALAAG